MRILSLFLFLPLVVCSTPTPQVSEEEVMREGMVSSSTYQVMVSVIAANAEEARIKGEPEARRKAFNLIVREPFFRGMLSDEGRRQLRLIVDQKGRVVRVKQEPDLTYTVFFQITQPGGIRDLFRNIR
ncbi:MAG: hypothetical protein JNM27_21965 [Leptospirales bacterium]|nr:hypothetical protein [Leptospirales bacterium]